MLLTRLSTRKEWRTSSRVHLFQHGTQASSPVRTNGHSCPLLLLTGQKACLFRTGEDARVTVLREDAQHGSRGRECDPSLNTELFRWKGAPIDLVRLWDSSDSPAFRPAHGT